MLLGAVAILRRSASAEWDSGAHTVGRRLWFRGGLLLSCPEVVGTMDAGLPDRNSPPRAPATHRRRVVARALLPGILAALFGAVSIPGCDYDDTKPCDGDAECAPGFFCDAGECRRSFVRECTEPADCASNETCAEEGICRVGDCTWEDIGCVEGYTCAASQGAWQCVPEEGAGGAGGAGSSAGGAGGIGDAGAPSMGGAGGDAGAPSAGADGDAGGGGSDAGGAAS